MFRFGAEGGKEDTHSFIPSSEGTGISSSGGTGIGSSQGTIRSVSPIGFVSGGSGAFPSPERLNAVVVTLEGSYATTLFSSGGTGGRCVNGLNLDSLRILLSDTQYTNIILKDDGSIILKPFTFKEEQYEEE